jgi:hypothetical protein
MSREDMETRFAAGDDYAAPIISDVEYGEEGRTKSLRGYVQSIWQGQDFENPGQDIMFVSYIIVGNGQQGGYLNDGDLLAIPVKSIVKSQHI